MITLLLDSNIWDKLADNRMAREKINAMCSLGTLKVVVPTTLKQELLNSPFKDIPDWFLISEVNDSISILNHSRLGEANLGNGEAYRDHLGESQKVSDAVLADLAHSEGAIFVSEDKRARKRFAEFAGSKSSLDFVAFQTDILKL